MTATIVKLVDDENGDLILPLDQLVCDRLGWIIGDTVLWTDNKDGTFSLKKSQPMVATEKILVETVQLTRIQYTVDVPVGKSVLALDAVVMKEATVLSSEYLDETIVSHRTITPAEFEQLSKGSDEQ